jgi:2,3-bisphosphoglycerate-independent phosphoglycerate mutase
MPWLASRPSSPRRPGCDRRRPPLTRAVRILFLFVDGVGLGRDDISVNPFAAADIPNLRRLWGGARPVSGTGAADRWLALDALLGVPGLPQSGTGQTALLTGLNAPMLVGGHRGPYPDRILRDVLAGRSLWRRAVDAGCSVALANAFPDRYLDRVRRGTARMGAIARSAHQAGVTLRGPDALRRGEAVSAFLTNDAWRTHLGYADLPVIDERGAGARLVALAAACDLVVFEHFATDIAGHRGSLDDAIGVVERLDRFVGGVLDHRATDTTVVMASDHGNLEDVSTPRHTTAPALAAWFPPEAAPPARTLCDVAPGVLAALGVAPD